MCLLWVCVCSFSEVCHSFSRACDFLLPLVSVCGTVGFLVLQQVLSSLVLLWLPCIQSMLVPCLHTKLEETEYSPLVSYPKFWSSGLIFYSFSFLAKGEASDWDVFPNCAEPCVDLVQGLLWLL